MIIQWFPGHMTKAFRLMEKEIKLVDAIIYVLDSRAPFSCVNPKFEKFIENKPIIYVFNKIDMAEKDKVLEWQKFFKKENTYCVLMNSTATGMGKKLEDILNQACSEKIKKYKEKNMNCVIRAMVVGVPNCGKSTLINNLCRKAKTVTGNKPGVTKGKQWVKIASGIELLDTPGTLWPAFDNYRVARNLAYIGSIKEEVLFIDDLAIAFIYDIMKIDKTFLEKRYEIKIEESDEPIDVLDKICYARKFLLKGAELDYERGCKAIISDFKQGKFGNITLETYKELKKLQIKDRLKNNA